MKASSRKTKDGQVIRYLQLAHNEWDARAGISRTKVLHSFGREDELDRDAVRRLVGALSRLLDPADAAAATAAGGDRHVGHCTAGRPRAQLAVASASATMAARRPPQDHR